MAKDPAFLFYPNDFDCATRFFSNEQVGIYLRLLIAQFQNGRLSEKHMNVICKTYDEDVFSKFMKDDNGLFYNERLENEVVKRKNYSESRRNNRKNKENISLSYVKHMENENTISFISKNTDTKKEDSNGTWLEEKKLFQNSEVYQYNIVSKYQITKEGLQKYIVEFLDQLELTEDFKSDKELKKHFNFWIQKKIEKKKTTPYQAPKIDYKVQTPRKDW